MLTGVSYMIPFVAAGGLLIALGFLFGGYEVANSGYGPDKDQGLADYVLGNFTLWDLPSGSLSPHAMFDSGFFLYIGCALFKLGALAFAFLVPALAGYIAYGIADRPGIAPGFTVGAVCVFTGAGFIGGLVGGILAGFVALWISRLKIPSWARGLMPVVVIPLFATLIAGGIMLMILGKPLATITTELQDALNSMSGTSAVVLGIILGLMMAFDMGGPVNKAAYAFATAGLSVTEPASLNIMAAVMLAGMVPPLALALAATLRPHLFNREEQENGKAAWALGASFISEGAIPFAAADPFRVIPAIMLGSATTGALAMAFDVQLSAPHGGIFVLFAVDGVFGFFIALIAGTIVGGLAVIAAKSIGTACRYRARGGVARPRVTPCEDLRHRSSIQKRTRLHGKHHRQSRLVRRAARPTGIDHLREGWRARRRRHLGGAGRRPGRRGLRAADHDARRLARRRGRGRLRRRRGGSNHRRPGRPRPRRLIPVGTCTVSAR